MQVNFSNVSSDLFFSIASFLQSPREVSPFIKKHRFCTDMRSLACVSKHFQKKSNDFKRALEDLKVENVFKKSLIKGRNLLSGIRMVDLSNQKLNKTWIKKLRERTTSVMALVFPNTHFQEKVAKSLLNLPSLTALNLFLCKKVDPESFQHLPGLRMLSFTISPYFLPPLFAADIPEKLLWEPAQGREFEIAGEKIDDAYLQELVTYAPNLESLSIDGKEISHVGLQAIGNLQNLQELCLETSFDMTCKLTPADLVHLKSLKKLKALTIHVNNQMDNTVIQKLVDVIPQITKLSLSCHQFPDISGIKNLEHLEKLSITASLQLKRISVEPLSHLTNLQKCKIVTYALDTSSLQSLSNLSNLKKLELQIFSLGKDFPAFRSLLPNCTVVLNDHRL